MAWYYILLLFAYCGTIISIVAVVLSENRNPVKSLAWITVLLTVPVFGFVLYIFFGRSLKNTRMITRRNRRRLRSREAVRHVDPLKASLSSPCRQTARMIQSMSGVPLYEGGSVQIFTNGRDKFESLFSDLASARKYILLQYYIIEGDETGSRLADLLIERASQGVKVRIIYDHIGSIHTKNSFFKRMADAGIEVYPFFRVNFPAFATRINWRNHRKIVVIDGVVGYIGGMNVANRYLTPGWRDTHLRIQGPAVGGLQYAFAVDWSFMGKPLIADMPDGVCRPVGTHYMQLLTSGPTSHWSNIAMVYIEAIGKAVERVYIQTPYFLPTDSLLRVLQAAALSKVDVRIMVPEKSDSRILTLASASYIEECLRAGIKFYLYKPGMLHAKTVVIDSDIVSVGSTNFDFRSFEHNFESNVFIYSAEVNARMAAVFLDDMSMCRRVNPGEWKRRPRVQKAQESMTRLLSPVL
ncbi:MULTISPECIES: cardiolipin synthase [Muribaculum]|jgi:cardiolipin synthase|uniref:Cardiolipin synthase n=3 Tax=Muribaculum TaxID=1918540 RepID=A0AC61S5D0_9BACT|nr:MULTISPECIES: cardiolipin synthase [Muribaculum]THG47678.1 cardiolipin synthase [Muribaculum caecicola]